MPLPKGRWVAAASFVTLMPLCPLSRVCYPERRTKGFFFMDNQEILIRKARRGKDFTTMPNETVRDPRLSMDTLGILLNIISLPEDWVIRKKDLEIRLCVGRRILDRAFNEMKNAGYLFEVDVVSNSTKFSGKGYLIYADSDKPADVQNVQREGGITDVQNVHLQKKQYNTTKETLIPPLSPKGENVGIDYKGLDKAVEAWLLYKAEKKQKYKSRSSVEIMVKKLNKLSGGDPGLAMQIIEEAIANNYQGFFELKTVKPLPISATPEQDGDAKMWELIKKGFKNLTPEQLRWVFEWQHRTGSSYAKYPDNIRLVKATSTMTKQDCIDADRAAGY